MAAQARNFEKPGVGRETRADERRIDLSDWEATARSNMYLFLSTVYLRPPTPALVRQVLNEDMLAPLSSLFGESTVAELRQFAGTPEAENALAMLEQEYMDLFAVPTGRFVAPFEDVYRGASSQITREMGPLLGERAVAVKRMYRAAGAQADRMCKELPTHIGVELSFMSFLCKREAVDADSDPEKYQLLKKPASEPLPSAFHYRRLQLQFLQRHLNTWFPQLNRAVQANAKTPFYRGLGRLTETFLARDMANLLAELPGERTVES